jgi:hypothetical protein
MNKYKSRKVLYFEEPGPFNTEGVIQAVKERIKEDDIRYVVVASISGETALKFAEKLKGLNVVVVCVSGFPGWLTIHGIEHPFVKGEIREKLEKLHIPIVDRTPSALSGDTIDYGLARYGYIPASWVMAETLEAVGGYGLKTAVEAMLMATDCGVVPPSVDVISIAGTDKGADTAIVAKSTFSPWVFSEDSNRRLQVLEIIAMPRVKRWYKRIGVGGLSFQEIQKGETIGPGAETI